MISCGLRLNLHTTDTNGTQVSVRCMEVSVELSVKQGSCNIKEEHKGMSHICQQLSWLLFETPCNFTLFVF